MHVISIVSGVPDNSLKRLVSSSIRPWLRWKKTDMDWGRLICSFSGWPGPLSSGSCFFLWSAWDDCTAFEPWTTPTGAWQCHFPVAMVACGSEHTLVLNCAGEVWACGALWRPTTFHLRLVCRGCPKPRGTTSPTTEGARLTRHLPECGRQSRRRASSKRIYFTTGCPGCQRAPELDSSFVVI